MKSNLNEKYIDLTHLIQTEFVRNQNRYGDKIKCRKGCSQCCSQIFRITELDASVIKDHIKNLAPGESRYLKDRAEEYLERRSGQNSNTDEFHKKPDIPCPALNVDGTCMIYEARPVICRRFGPPVYDYKNPEKLFACELNFQNGEEIIDNELVPNQTLIGKKWDELKTLYNEENALKENSSTTIAEAILDS